MKIIKIVVPVVLVVGVVGYLLFQNFFGINKQMQDAAITVYENVEKGEMNYKFIIQGSTGENSIYEYNGESVTYTNGAINEEYAKGSEEYEEGIDYVLNMAKSADVSELNPDIEVVNDLDLEIDGVSDEDLAGEWYAVNYTGGCQSGSCKIRGVAGTDTYGLYIKTDGTGYISSSGQALFLYK